MNYISLLLLACAIFLSMRKRMLPYAVAIFFFGFLTVGQGLYFDRVMTEGGWIEILNAYINWEGYQDAKYYVLWLSLGFLFTALIAPRYSLKSAASRHIFLPDRSFYLLFLAAELFIFIFLVFVVVGYSEFLASSRPGYQSGATIFIVLLFMGVVPILLKLGCGQKPNKWDVLLFGLATAMTSSFSRIHCIFYITSLVYAAYYGFGLYARKINFTTAVLATSLALTALFIFFGIGALRDALNFTDANLSSIFEYIRENPEKSLLSLDHNYTVGVEGMSGIAGAITFAQLSPSSVSFDYGSHWLIRGSLQWLPGFAKEYLGVVYTFLDGINWYKDSIVAPGVESAFTSFGWFGIPIFCLLLYFFVWQTAGMQAQESRPRIVLVRYVALGLGIFLIRGSWTVWVGYSITYFLLLNVTWFIFKKHFKPTR